MADAPRERAPRYVLTLVAGLLGAGAVTVAVVRPWAAATATPPGLPTLHAEATGADLVPLAGALGVVLLAAFGAVVATRGWVRRALGALIVVAALIVLVAAIHPTAATDTLTDGLAAKGWTGGDYTSDSRPWRWLALAGAVLCLLAGAAVLRHGHRWPTMGSRYDAPAAAAPTEADAWRAIDEGRDPTQRS